MIIIHIAAGIGNQMFQYAMGRFLAHRRNTELKLDITQCENSKDSHHSHYQLDNFNIIENFASTEEINSVKRINEKDIKNPSEVFMLPDNILLCGGWINDVYFNEIKDILSKEFTLKNPLGKNSAKWKESILSTKCAVSLHVRLGDYLLPTFRNNPGAFLPLDYYDNCIAELRNFVPHFKIFVFSDDLKWCKENLKFDLPTEFVEGCERDSEEIYLMSLCHHNITAPYSTFSRWGALLNQHPDKKVFISKVFENQHQDSHFISMPVDYGKKPLVETLPMISIVIYWENNATTINPSLVSILNQNLKDYEIILLDASTDGSGKICRQAANYDKINIITVSRFIKKVTAWNKGLDIASGDYVLFLTGKDFLFPHTLNFLSDTYTQAYNKNLNNRNQEHNYDKFTKLVEYMPDIISITKTIEEDDNAQITIEGMPNKKFSVKVDRVFENLNETVKLNLSNEEKLISLSTHGINRELGTKFFKRSFLNENNIRFRTGGGSMDSKLLFLVETFLCTEKITFTPQVFYGRLK